MSRIVEQGTLELIHGRWWFCLHGKYGEDSVLHGQEFRQLVECYDEDFTKAQAAHPESEVFPDGWEPGPAELPEAPELWFDPMDAGEAWSEEDY